MKGDNGPGNKSDNEPEVIKLEIDESLKFQKGLITADKGEGVFIVIWGNDPTILADLYIV